MNASHTRLPASHRFAFAHFNGFSILALNRLLAFGATSVTGVFMPIFLFEYFHESIQAVFLFYFIEQMCRLPFFAPGAKLFSRIGLTKSMVLGGLGLAVFYVMCVLLSRGQSAYDGWVFAIAIAGLTANNVLYWSPYSIELAELSSKEKRGRQLSWLYSVQRLIGVVAPLVSAYIITQTTFYGAFVLGTALMLLSLIPLRRLPPYRVTYEFGYWQTFRELWTKDFRPMTISMMARGAEGMIGVVVWPIFLALIFKGDYINIGIYSALVLLITVVFQLFIGKETDKMSAGKILHIGSGMYALGWIWKGFVQTITGVFAASTFHSFGSIMIQTPADALSYEQAADAGHYIDEYTVLKEMALNIGRIGIMLMLFVASFFIPLEIAFFFAAVLSLCVNMLTQQGNKKSSQ